LREDRRDKDRKKRETPGYIGRGEKLKDPIRQGEDEEKRWDSVSLGGKKVHGERKEGDVQGQWQYTMKGL